MSTEYIRDAAVGDLFSYRVIGASVGRRLLHFHSGSKRKTCFYFHRLLFIISEESHRQIVSITKVSTSTTHLSIIVPPRALPAAPYAYRFTQRLQVMMPSHALARGWYHLLRIRLLLFLDGLATTAPTFAMNHDIVSSRLSLHRSTNHANLSASTNIKNAFLTICLRCILTISSQLHCS